MEFLAAAETFVQNVIRCQSETGNRVLPGQALRHGYWTVKFVPHNEELEIWEHSPDTTEFIPGVTWASYFWKSQVDVCAAARASFVPPSPDQLVAVTEGVLEGVVPVEGVRYPSPSHMSGWWLSTDLYNGEVSTIKTVHLYHLTARIPQLAAFLALPNGYRFRVDGAEYDVWFDDQALRG